MAMVQCPECKNNISDKAVTCPHCGCPVRWNQAETLYQLEKGMAGSDSGFSKFLKILAWVTWIGGLIISIVGANTRTYSYGPTEFSFSTFLTLFITYAINGAILMGLATMVQRIEDTYSIVYGLRINKTTVQGEKPRVKPVTAPSAGTVAQQKMPDRGPGVVKAGGKDNYGWIVDEDPLFVRCPGCDMRASIDYMKFRNACPQCGHEHIVRESGAGNNG